MLIIIKSVSHKIESVNSFRNLLKTIHLKMFNLFIPKKLLLEVGDFVKIIYLTLKRYVLGAIWLTYTNLKGIFS